MKNIFLYFSAFVPLYFLILVKFIVGTISKSISFDAQTILTFIVYGSLTIFGIIGLLWNMYSKKSKKITIKITDSKNITDQHFLSYFSLFVFFALGFQLTRPSMLIVSIIIIIFIGIVYVNNKMFYINPLLNILGYNFFEITYSFESNPDKQLTDKIFCKGTLKNKKYLINIHNKNFMFIYNDDNKKNDN